MNGFMKYDHGTLASAYFEHIRRTDADFRRCVYDSRIAMYKTNQKRFSWPPHHVSKCDDRRQIEPGFATIPKLTDEQLNKVYTPKIVFRKLSDNKRIEPPLDYSKDTQLMGKEQSKKSMEKFEKSLYQATYNVYHTPSCRGNEKDFLEETPEEWVQKWKDECRNQRDADDLVQDWSRRVVNEQKISLNRKRIGYE